MIKADEKEKYAEYLCSPAWGRLRSIVYERSNGTCEVCRYRNVDAVHHKTYIRKYKEIPDDLIGICSTCHEFQHGRISGNRTCLDAKVYVAGKIRRDCFRHASVPELSSFTISQEHDTGGIIWSGLQVRGEETQYCLDYVGPFFMSNGHGGGHDENSHGRAENSESSQTIIKKCLSHIACCDMVLAWIEDQTAYGTLVEIGAAVGLRKPVYVASDRHLPDLWFAFGCSRIQDRRFNNFNEFAYSVIRLELGNSLSTQRQKPAQ